MHTGMTSRERVLTALAHEEPDRVPVEFGCSLLSSILYAEPYGYKALCEYLGIADYPTPDINLYLNSVKNVDPRIMELFGADLRWVTPGGPDPILQPDGTWRDASWGYVVTPTGPVNTFVDAKAPLRFATSRDEIETYPYWPDLTDQRIWEGKREEARRLQEAGYAVVSSPGGALQIFHNYSFLRGFDMWLMDMHEDPRFYHIFAEKILEVDIAYMEVFLPAVADYTDIVYMGDDLAMQQSPLMSLDDYRTFCKPYQIRWVEAVRRLAPKAKILYHCCGSAYSLIPEFIEVGIDILNPLQPKARDMDPWRIKREFGDALSFLGGFDIQELLPFGTPAQIRDGARELIDAYGPGGGYIFATAHEILPEVKPENIVVMFEAALEHGRYPLVRTPGAAGAATRDTRKPH